jgi:3-oxoacyl-[acyl-carrier-protein] synthase-3
MDRVMLTVQRYGNMSAATVPVALAEAVESGRVRPGALVLMPAFGAGLTLCAHLLRWGDRVTPLGRTVAALPPRTKSALELVRDIRMHKARAHERSAPGLQSAVLVDVPQT